MLKQLHSELRPTPVKLVYEEHRPVCNFRQKRGNEFLGFRPQLLSLSECVEEIVSADCLEEFSCIQAR